MIHLRFVGPSDYEAEFSACTDLVPAWHGKVAFVKRSFIVLVHVAIRIQSYSDATAWSRLRERD